MSDAFGASLGLIRAKDFVHQARAPPVILVTTLIDSDFINLDELNPDCHRRILKPPHG